MKKNETQPKAVQGTTMAKSGNANALVILTSSENTPEDLKAENERLKRLVESVPASLDQRIEYYNQKKVWITQLARIEAEEKKLQLILREVADEMEDNDFLTENFSVVVLRHKKYSADEELIKIQNPVIVGDVMHAVLKRMKEKIDELEISISN